MRKVILYLFALMMVSTIQAQESIDYNWDKPAYDIDEGDKALEGIILKDFRGIYFKKLSGPYVRLSEKTETVHKRIYVNSDEVIERYNKVFIPTRDVNSVSRLKVRTINKDGKVTELNPDNLKVLDNVEGYGEFTIFAIEGIEKGGIVEYLYEFEMQPIIFGSETFQTDLPIKYAELYLYGKSMEFEVKGYNGAVVKTIKDGRKHNVYGGVMKDIPAFKEEFYAANHANKVRVDYIVEGFNWEGLSQTIMSNTLTKSEVVKKIEQVLNEELNIESLETKADKVSAIEQYVKDNYQVIQDYGKDLSNVNNIIETKFSSVTGITYLFAALFNVADIDYELVASCDRFSRKFDRDFPSPYNLDYLMFYFADLKRFLMPYPFNYKDGLVPDFLLTQEGFSIASTYSKAMNFDRSYRFVDIKSNNEFDTKVTETINVHLKKEEDPFISVMIDLQGYRALEFITTYNQVALDRRKEYTTFFVPQSLANQVNPNKITLNGSGAFNEDITENSVTIYAELPADQFIEKAGRSILFKLGDLIGKQMELYQEDDRVQDMELNYHVDYDRTITFQYDEDFTVEGQEEIVIHTDHLPDDLYEKMRFYSSYEDDGSKLEVSIDEYYKFIHMDKKHYPYFRDVINAAANFNKVSLLITYND